MPLDPYLSLKEWSSRVHRLQSRSGFTSSPSRDRLKTEELLRSLPSFDWPPRWLSKGCWFRWVWLPGLLHKVHESVGMKGVLYLSLWANLSRMSYPTNPLLLFHPRIYHYGASSGSPPLYELCVVISASSTSLVTVLALGGPWNDASDSWKKQCSKLWRQFS